MLRKGLLIFLGFLPWLTEAQTSFNCFPLTDCDDVRLLIIRETPPQGSCPTVGYGSCSQADAFHQVVYRVYLRYVRPGNTPTSDLTFNLDYERLTAGIRLINASNDGFSYIDQSATRACYADGVGSSWSQTGEVLFDVDTRNQVAINFQNDSQSACGGAGTIAFSPTAPSGAPACPFGEVCTYAELFPVIVQAYAGETISLGCVTLQYEDFGETIACLPGTCAVNNANGVTTYTIPTPSAPAGENLNLKLDFGTPTVNNDGEYEVDVVLKKAPGTFGTSTVSYHEFMVKLTSDVALPTPTSSDATRTVEIRKINGVYEYYLYHVVKSTFNLSPGGSTTVVTLTIGPPMPINQIWEATLEFVETSDSRIRSSSECSTLEQGDEVKIDNPVGEVPCGALVIPSAVFRVEGVGGAGQTCDPPGARLGFEITGSPYNITFDYFECQIAFQTTDNLTVSDVTFPLGMPCNNSNPCTPTACWSTVSGFPNTINIRMCDDNGPLDFSEETFIEVEFEGVGCINGADIEIIRIQRDITDDPCVPELDLTDQGFPVCTPQLQGVIAAHFAPNEGIDNVLMELTATDLTSTCQTQSTCLSFEETTEGDGVFSFCPCDDCATYLLNPISDGTDYLNGVTTFDLVQINKHVLNIITLGTYQIFAGDVNASKSVTQYDIAEIRKLLLGIYTVFPISPSWRFVPQSHVFVDPDNPWYGGVMPPSSIEYPDVNGYDFFAIKIGDVNDSALPEENKGEASATYFSWPETARKRNQMITIPIRYEGSELLEAYQAGFKFDPNVFEFVGVSQGDLPGIDPGSFGLERVKDGEIRTLWFVPDYSNPQPYLKPGTVLFYLTFKTLNEATEYGLPLVFDDNVLPSLAWSPDSKVYKVVKSEPAPERVLVEETRTTKVVCSPNPTTGAVKFSLSNQVKQTARLVLMDPFGNVLWMQTIALDASQQTIAVDVLMHKPAGVYVWKLWSPDGEMQTGHIVKQ
ncbi:MAG: hypothetical protein IT270_09025 [Saprospiraceae bacterium]|nr:hypothetical protein [Saprospiraceae bacterium]